MSEPYDVKKEQLPRCPYMVTKRAGDESVDLCDIKMRPRYCSGTDECEVYNDYIEEKE